MQYHTTTREMGALKHEPSVPFEKWIDSTSANSDTGQKGKTSGKSIPSEHEGKQQLGNSSTGDGYNSTPTDYWGKRDKSTTRKKGERNQPLGQ
jgi:hypothetical protein